MSDPHGTTAAHDDHGHAPDPAHHADQHAAGHDDHHDTGTLGSFDWRMWAIGVVGVAAAAVVTAAFALATGFSFSV